MHTPEGDDVADGEELDKLLKVLRSYQR